MISSFTPATDKKFLKMMNHQRRAYLISRQNKLSIKLCLVRKAVGFSNTVIMNSNAKIFLDYSVEILLCAINEVSRRPSVQNLAPSAVNKMQASSSM